MVQLVSFTKRRFTNWGIFQLFSDINHHLESETDEQFKLFIAKTFEAHKIAFEAYDKALLADKTAGAPGVFDEKRNWALRKIYAICNVHKDFVLDEVRQNASIYLRSILKRYGSISYITKLAQDRKSAAITNMLQDLKAEGAKAHTEALGFDKLIAYIEENNEAFIAARRLVTKENMELAGQVKSNRTSAEEAWDKLRAAINGYVAANVDDAEGFALIDQLNATIEHHKLAVRRARSGKSGDEETSNPPQE